MNNSISGSAWAERGGQTASCSDNSEVLRVIKGPGSSGGGKHDAVND